MNLEETLKDIELQAGGPGSGRKPTWAKRSSNHQELNDMHRQQVGAGYAYKGSRYVDTATRVHTYTNDKGESNHIVERLGGKHSVISDK